MPVERRLSAGSGESEGEQVVLETILETPLAEETIASEINMSDRIVRLDKSTTKPWFSE